MGLSDYIVNAPDIALPSYIDAAPMRPSPSCSRRMDGGGSRPSCPALRPIRCTHPSTGVSQ